MPVLSPGENGMFIDHIDGLGPVDDNIITKAFGNGSGEYFVGRQRGKRNIVLHFGFESRGHDVAAARNELIRTFYTVGSTTSLLRFIFDDGASVDIEGYLETEESDMFASDSECTLSIICPKPNFRSTTMSLATGVTDHDPDLTDLTNLGNRETGIAVRLIPLVGHEDLFANDVIYETKIATATPGVFHTINRLHINAQTSDLPDPMQPGEEFWIDTRLGKKSVYIYTPSTGAVRNAMRGMTSDSTWPKLYPGTSKFSVAIDYWAQGVHPMDWTAYWYDEYGSI
jgi:hypothetical protein